MPNGGNLVFRVEKTSDYTTRATPAFLLLSNKDGSKSNLD